MPDTESLITCLSQFGLLNQQQVDLVRSKVKTVILEKDEYFSEAGKIPKRVAFINTGILRVYSYNSNAKEVTKYFIDEGNFAVDLSSFTQKTPSSEYIQAVTKCSLLTFSTEVLKELSIAIAAWDSIISQVTSKALIRKVNRISPMLSEDATTRYLKFLEKYPNLANRIPLSYLASYLGITQSSLSRIRKNI